MRSRGLRERVDFAVYGQSLFLLLRNPIIILGPLLSTVLTTLVAMVDSSSSNVFGAATIFGLLTLVIRVFGLAIAVIVADMVWRRGRSSFDEAWEESRRKAGDIVFAGFGLSMLVYVAQYIGAIFSSYLGLILGVVAICTFIYAIPAAAIGGAPGGYSLQASLDLTRSRPINTVLLAIVSFIVVIGVGFIVPSYFFSTYGTYETIIAAALQAVAIGYVATCLAKRYTDAAIRNM